MNLAQAKRGQQVSITAFKDPQVRDQAMRLGLMEGQVVRCVEVIPSGPIVLGLRRQEIALGRSVAAKVEVVLASQRAQEEAAAAQAVLAAAD